MTVRHADAMSSGDADAQPVPGPTSPVDRTRRSSRTWATALVVVSTLVLAAGAFGVWRQGQPCHLRATGTVALPAPDASPAEVATAFVEALNAGDHDTATALMSPSAREQYWGWTIVGPAYFGHVCHVAGFRVTDVIALRPEELVPDESGDNVRFVVADMQLDVSRGLLDRILDEPGNGLDTDWHAGSGGHDLAGPGTIELVRGGPSAPWRIGTAFTPDYP
jgi:hypothetical protein